MKKILLGLVLLAYFFSEKAYSKDPDDRIFCLNTSTDVAFVIRNEPDFKKISGDRCNEWKKKYMSNTNYVVNETTWEVYKTRNNIVLTPEEIAEEKKLKEQQLIAEKKLKEEQRQLTLEKDYGKECTRFTKGSDKYKNCLEEKDKYRQAKLDQENKLAKVKLDEQKRLSTLPAAERYAYTCEKTYGFKKGSDNFRDCVFKIMTTEYEIQRAADQRRIAELESKINNNSSSYNSELLEIERLKAKALQDQANAIRNRNQTDALMDLSRSLLNNNNRAPANAPNLPLNCRSVRVGNNVQTQCY